MPKLKNINKILIIIAIAVLVLGVYITLYGSSSIFNIEPTGNAVAPTTMTGMVTVNVITPNTTTGGTP